MVSVMLYPCIVCVALLIYLFIMCVACLTVFVNCLVRHFAIYLEVGAVLLLTVMEVFSVGGGTLLDRPCVVFQRILPFGMLCLSTISMMFAKIMLAVCMLMGMVV